MTMLPKGCFEMKRNYKTKTKNIESDTAAKKTSAKAATVTKDDLDKVSFILVSGSVLCFRECAKIVKVAEETGCMVSIASGKQSGTTESIMSLAALGIMPGTSLVLTIKGERREEAFRDISKIISGKADE